MSHWTALVNAKLWQMEDLGRTEFVDQYKLGLFRGCKLVRLILSLISVILTSEIFIDIVKTFKRLAKLGWLLFITSNTLACKLH